MRVKDLKELYEKSGTLKIQTNDNKEPLKTVIGQVSERRPTAPILSMPRETPTLTIPVQTQPNNRITMDFMKELNSKLGKKPVPAQIVQQFKVEEPRSILKKKESEINLDDIITKADRNSQQESRMVNRFGINENYKTRQQEQKIFEEMYKQTQNKQPAPVSSIIEGNKKSIVVVDRKTDFSREQSMANRPSKQSIIGKLEDKGEKLNRINYVLNFIFDKQESETVTGKVRSSIVGKLDSTLRPSESVTNSSNILTQVVQQHIKPPQEVKPTQNVDNVSFNKDLINQIARRFQKKEPEAVIEQTAKAEVKAEQTNLLEVRGKKKAKKLENFDDL